MTIDEAAAHALRLHQSNRLAEAEAIYRDILATAPDYADAWHLLGVAEQQRGLNAPAVEKISRAIALLPQGIGYHRHLGIALQALGRNAEALAAYDIALGHDPDDVAARNNRAILRQGAGQFAESLEDCRAAIRLQPGLVEAHNNLGNALRSLGLPAEAAVAFREAIRLAPTYAEAHNNLGCVLLDQGAAAEAVQSFRQALYYKPDLSACYFNLAKALRDQGLLAEAILQFQHATRFDPNSFEAWFELADTLNAVARPLDAVPAYQAALNLRPEHVLALNNFGNALKDLHRYDEAERAYLEAIRLQPNYAVAHSNLSCTYRDTGRPADAISECRKAIEADPTFAVAYNNLACGLKDEGDMDGAIAAFLQGHEAALHIPQILSNVIYTMHSHLPSGAAEIAAQHRRWNELYAAPLHHKRRPFERPRDPDKKLKIGYTSPDFWAQAECYFVLPLFRGHTHEEFEIHAYASSRMEDHVTAEQKRHVDRWHDVSGLNDEQLAAKVRADGIDVLIDLTMHMANSRLPAYALKPAPVQVSWLAYPGTTGLDGMDYWLTDSHMEPPGEELLADPGGGHPYRLPDSWCCYHPVTDMPPVTPLPALTNGFITFGSLNNFCKMNEAVLEQWAGVLHAVPRSRLVLLCPVGTPRERIRSSLERKGIESARLDFHAHLPRPRYIDLYHQIDIGLDPFPYNGITTTCDAMWMGVPVVSLPQKMPASRAGLSLLSTAGLPELAPLTEDAYREEIQRLVGDLPALAKMRAGLREKFQASPILDHQQFARYMEQAYREMWKRWCAEGK